MKRKSIWALGPFMLRALAILVTLFIALTAYGAAYEHAMRTRAATAFPARGRFALLDGNRRIQIDCRGAGSPTVVLESGLDNLGSSSWMAVHDSIAHITRACAYSRAGILWSERSGAHFSSRLVAHDLHDALGLAGEVGPWVMVGHSIGGAYVLRFAAEYPDDVSGLVLVDPSHPDQFNAFRAVTGKSLEPPTSMARVGAALAWTGVLRLLLAQSPSTWPSETRAAAEAYLPTSLAAVSAEAIAIPATLRDARAVRDLGSRPLIVLSATEAQPTVALQAMGITRAQGDAIIDAQHRLHADLSHRSSCGRHKLVPRSSHYIQFDRPDIVINAIRDVVLSVRTIGRTASPASPCLLRL